jgi:hypothetical protein
VSIVIYVNPKNFLLLTTLDSTHKSGIKATNIRKVKGETGQAAHNKRPLPKANKRFLDRFKKNVCVKIVV